MITTGNNGRSVRGVEETDADKGNLKYES